MLTPKEQKIINVIRREAAPTGHSDDRTKSELRREQRTLLAIIDRITGSASIEACRLIVKWHQGVFVTGRALKLDNDYPVDHTDLNEAARLAKEALACAPVPQRAQSADEIARELLCDDCPPVDYPTDMTRCKECPRRLFGGARMCDCVGPHEAEPQPCHCGKGLSQG